MKYIHSVMADYIKPLITSDHRRQTDTKDKIAAKEEEKKIVPSGMGDFEYHELPLELTSQIEEEHFDRISRKTKNLVTKIEYELAQNFEEQKCLENRINTYEGELQKRKNLYDLCSALFDEQLREIEKYAENMKRFDDTISHHEEVLDSWQCLMEEFRKIPEECM